MYSSLLTTWRRERAFGIRQALTPQKRGPKSKRDPIQEEIQKLQKDNVRLTEQLRKAEIVIDVQKSGRAVGVADPDSRPGRETLMDAVHQLAPTVGVESACDAVGVARASFYRRPVTKPPLRLRRLR